MNDTKKTACVIGPRPKDLCGYQSTNENMSIEQQYGLLTDDLKYHMQKLVRDMGVSRFISNGSQGIGQMAACAACDIAEENPDIEMEILEPYDEQDALWKEDGVFGKKEYRSIRERADKVSAMCRKSECDNITKAHHDCYHEMIDRSDVVLIYWSAEEDPSAINSKSNAIVDAANYALQTHKKLRVYDWHATVRKYETRDRLPRPKKPSGGNGDADLQYMSFDTEF